MTRNSLILTDAIFVVTITVMQITNGGIDKNPLLLNVLVVVALASCIIRHINYYKQHRKLY